MTFYVPNMMHGTSSNVVKMLETRTCILPILLNLFGAVFQVTSGKKGGLNGPSIPVKVGD